jgi:CPA2 family monovalent cation:H+ antiporter-2
MFGVGLHFSLKDLLSVKAIAIPGAIVQIAVATLLGLGLAMLMEWKVSEGLVFGLALSVASTVVLLRALQERRLMETGRGRIAVGWLIVEDLAMVLALVLIPTFANLQTGNVATAVSLLGAHFELGLGGVLLLTAVKVALFIALMLVVGRRLIPWILHSRTRDRASCSGSRCWRSHSASHSDRPNCSTYRWRWGRFLPG